MKSLRNHSRATGFTKDFLLIIEKQMLVVEKEKRATALSLNLEFDQLKLKCQANRGYYTPRGKYDPSALEELISIFAKMQSGH